MSIQLYHKTCYGLSRKLTNAYSTSFSLGIRVFAPEYRDPIYAIYGYVRVADEIVDTFHGHDKERLLEKFREDTEDAIREGISANPVLHAFQKVVKEYNINWELIDAFLTSMEMDLHNSSYKRVKYDNYIYGSAEVVGLMCLKVFCNNNEEMYKNLEYPAKMLGAAFQKVNFLRDIKDDIAERGRIYLPGIDNQMEINNENKKKLEEEIDKEFHEALLGILKLPIGVKLGVYSAYLYYYMLFNKIRNLDVSELLKRRVRISNTRKIILLIKSYIEVKLLKLT